MTKTDWIVEWNVGWKIGWNSAS